MNVVPAPTVDGLEFVTVLMPVTSADTVVEPAGLKTTVHSVSQSPAVSETVARSMYDPLVRDTLVTAADWYSPILPAFALSFVVVPMMPAVDDGVYAPDVDSVVNAPVLAVVFPIGPGLANREVKPAPLTVLVADSVVNAPVDAVVDPIGPGAANVAPPSCAALIAVLQVSAPAPPAVVQFRALADVLQLGTAIAVGDALEAVAFATIVFAACAARLASPILPVDVNVPLTVRLLNVGEG